MTKVQMKPRQTKWDGLFCSSNIFGRRKTFAPSTKPKFARDAILTKEHMPSPVKRPRMEVYQEVRKVQPPVYKVAESKPVNPGKVIEKEPQLYAAALGKPLPQRGVPPRLKPVPLKQLMKKPVSDTTAKPVEKALERKQEAKKAPEVKEVNAENESVIAPEDTKPTVEPNKDGQYELTSTMSSILHDELQQIMIKVWQELPDAPPTDAERLVANRFRNELGEDLLDSMGLSVTARLLNVHNPLYVKLHFSGKPEAGRLQAFIRDYKITAFKRIGDSLRDTFAARFDRIADFDRLCVHDEVKCGSATVTITPCYKYLLCPPSVKTIYADNIAKTKTRTSNSSPQRQADTDKKQITESAEVKTVTKEVVKKVDTETEKSKPQANTGTNKSVTTDTDSKKAVKRAAVVAQQPKAEMKATKEVTDSKKITPKKVDNNNEVKKTAVVAQEPKIEKNAAKAVTEPKKVTPEKVDNNNEVKKTAEVAQEPKIEKNATKEVSEPKKVTPKKVDNNNEVKKTADVAQESKIEKNAAKEVAEPKKVTPKKVENKNEVKKNNVVDTNKNDKEFEAGIIDDMMVVDEMGEEDDEEMTDQDILALISGGIVVDECSGSDDEN